MRSFVSTCCCYETEVQEIRGCDAQLTDRTTILKLFIFNNLKTLSQQRRVEERKGDSETCNAINHTKHKVCDSKCSDPDHRSSQRWFDDAVAHADNE